MSVVTQADQTVETEDELPGVFEQESWRAHPVDLRFTMPLLGFSIYLTVVAGQERRSGDRRRTERRRHRVHTFGNVAFVALVTGSLYLAFLLAALAASAVIDF